MSIASHGGMSRLARLPDSFLSSPILASYGSPRKGRQNASKSSTDEYTFDPDGDIELIIGGPAEDGPQLDRSPEKADDEQNSFWGPLKAGFGQKLDKKKDKDAKAKPAPAAKQERASLNSDFRAEWDKLKATSVNMKVSSKCLGLTSPVFKAMLSQSEPVFLEGHTLAATGHLDLPLPDDHPVALKLIMNIVHFRFERVPKKLEFHTLLAVAIMVDKYHFRRQLFVPFCEEWIINLRPEFPTIATKLPRERGVALKWLTIFHVFGIKEEIKHLSAMMMYQGDDTVCCDEDDLPLPDQLLETIEGRRIEAIKGLVHDMISIVEKFTKNNRCFCPRADGRHADCDAMSFGKLMVVLTKAKLWPKPSEPFKGLNFKSLETQLVKAQLNGLCQTERDYLTHIPTDQKAAEMHAQIVVDQSTRNSPSKKKQAITIDEAWKEAVQSLKMVLDTRKDRTDTYRVSLNACKGLKPEINRIVCEWERILHGLTVTYAWNG